MTTLSGLLVADFSRVLAGPYATMLLADLGADVVKVERPGSGDDTRSWGPPFVAEESTYFVGVNRNKRSIALDLSAPSDLALARDLVVRADVLVENFRPGTMDRLGLGYSTVKSANPRLVYCSITGFGSGAGAGLPGYDLLVQAVGGLMSVTGDPDGPGVKTGVALVDVITGLHAAVGILAALRERDRTGVGQQVSVTLLTSLLSALVNQASGYVAAGVVPEKLGNRHPSIAPYEVFAAADRPLVIAVGNDRQFAALCAALDVPDLARDPRFRTNADRVAHRASLAAALTERLGTGTADDWFATLSAVGVPCGPINDVAGAFALAESLGLDPVVRVDDPRRDHPVPQVANPIHLGAAPAAYRLAPPRLDEDAEWVRERLTR
ncbi:CoA transferase [Actinomycetes bacterium KLBMP 9797]